VRLQGGAFVVTCVPNSLANSIVDEFGEDVDVSTPIRFTIGNPDLDQRERIKNIKQLIEEAQNDYHDGAPMEVVLERAADIGMDESKAEHEIDKLKQKGEVYEPSTDTLRTT